MVYISAMTFKKFFFCFYLFFDFRLNFFHFELCFFRRLRGFFLLREDIFRTRTIVFFILFIMLITIVCAMKCFWKNITNKGNLQKGMGSIVVCRLFVFLNHNTQSFYRSTTVKVCKCLNPYIMNHLFFIEYRHFFSIFHLWIYELLKSVNKFF